MSTATHRPVVVGVDGRPGSAGAVRYAAAEAGRRQAPLHLVHVVPDLSMGPPVPLTDLEGLGTSILERAAAAARELDPGLDVHTVLGRGERDAGILQAARDAELVVVGRDTRHGLDLLFSGPTTSRVASHSPVDVVVVPSFWAAERRRGRVVVGVKPGRDAHQLLARAFADAAALGAALTVVTAWHVADPYLDRIETRTHAADWQAGGVELLDKLVAEWRPTYRGVDVELRVEHGSPSRVLLDVSRDADLLVISRRKHGVPPYGRLGGVGHDLIRLSDNPVHVVPYTPDPMLDDLVLEEGGAPLK